MQILEKNGIIKEVQRFFVTFFIKFLFIIVIFLRATRVILWLFWLKKSLLFK